MSNYEQIANIVAFLTILFGENSDVWHEIMLLSPNYIMEKFERYILSSKIEYPWGMHPSLRNVQFQRYVDKWSLELKNE